MLVATPETTPECRRRPLRMTSSRSCFLSGQVGDLEARFDHMVEVWANQESEANARNANFHANLQSEMSTMKSQCDRMIDAVKDKCGELDNKVGDLTTLVSQLVQAQRVSAQSQSAGSSAVASGQSSDAQKATDKFWRDNKVTWALRGCRNRAITSSTQMQSVMQESLKATDSNLQMLRSLSGFDVRHFFSVGRVRINPRTRCWRKRN